MLKKPSHVDLDHKVEVMTLLQGELTAGFTFCDYRQQYLWSRELGFMVLGATKKQ